MIKPVIGYLEHVGTAHFYGVLKPGSSKVNICLCTMSTKEVVVSKNTAIGD